MFILKKFIHVHIQVKYDLYRIFRPYNIETFVGDFIDESSEKNSPITADFSNKYGTRSFPNAFFADTAPEIPDLTIVTDSSA